MLQEKSALPTRRNKQASKQADVAMLQEKSALPTRRKKQASKQAGGGIIGTRVQVTRRKSNSQARVAQCTRHSAPEREINPAVTPFFWCVARG